MFALSPELLRVRRDGREASAYLAAVRLPKLGKEGGCVSVAKRTHREIRGWPDFFLSCAGGRRESRKGIVCIGTKIPLSLSTNASGTLSGACVGGGMSPRSPSLGHDHPADQSGNRVHVEPPAVRRGTRAREKRAVHAGRAPGPHFHVGRLARSAFGPGRAEETFGEDPFLIGRFTRAAVTSLQKPGPYGKIHALIIQ